MESQKTGICEFGAALRVAEELYAEQQSIRISDRVVSRGSGIEKSRLSRIIHGQVPSILELRQLQRFFWQEPRAVELLETAYKKLVFRNVFHTHQKLSEESLQSIVDDIKKAYLGFKTDNLSNVHQVLSRQFKIAYASDEVSSETKSIFQLYTLVCIERCEFESAKLSIKTLARKMGHSNSEIRKVFDDFNLKLISLQESEALPESIIELCEETRALFRSFSLSNSKHEATFAETQIIVDSSMLIGDYMWSRNLQVVREWLAHLRLAKESRDQSIPEIATRMAIIKLETLLREPSSDREISSLYSDSADSGFYFFFHIERLVVLRDFYVQAKMEALGNLVQLAKWCEDFGYYFQARRTKLLLAQMSAVLEERRCSIKNGWLDDYTVFCRLYFG